MAVRYLLCASLITSAVFPIGHSVAEPYILEAPVRIFTETGFEDSERNIVREVWIAVNLKENDKIQKIRFLPEGNSEKEYLCEIKFQEDETGKSPVWLENKSGRKRTGADGLLFNPGYPVPCDVIPFEKASDGDSYTIKSEAGGRTFLKTYTIKIEMVDKKTAKAKEWLRIDMIEDKGLQMVTMTDERGKAVIRQLWPIGETWWVFEETKNRRSWRIP